MNEFDIKSRERLVRVEEGVDHLTELLKTYIAGSCTEHGCILKEDVASLKTTQKYIRWVSKTTIGAALIALITFIIKGT